MEAATHVVADATAGHRAQGTVHYLGGPRLPGVEPAREQEIQRPGMRELRLGAEAAVAKVERAGHGVGCAGENVG